MTSIRRMVRALRSSLEKTAHNHSHIGCVIHVAAHINIRGAHLVFGIGCYPFKMIRNPSKGSGAAVPFSKRSSTG